MSFKLTIIIPDTKISETLKRLNGHQVTVEHMAVEKSDKPRIGGSVPGSRLDSHLTMTGKQPRKGTVIYPAVVAFEKLEASKGIGNVTVKMFKAEIRRRKWKEGLVQRCLTEKFLTYL